MRRVNVTQPSGPSTNASVYKRTGERGFERACVVHPDVIVADVMLPGITGLELTRRLGDDHRTKDAAIIVLTARTFGSDAQQAASAGCDRFLLKHCLPDELASEIRNVLTRRGQHV